MTKYNARYFIDKFAAIPEEMWCVGTYINYAGQCCAIGHCGIYGEEADALRNCLESGADTTDVNDGKHIMAQLGDTPRERILNALILVEAGIWRELV